jgi:hypothetical protein
VIGMQLKLVTDNEWEGKYELLEQQFKEDGLSIIALGDLLPTGSRKQVGGKSHFKTHIKPMIAKDPSIKKLSLYEQLQLVYDLDPDAFIQNYREAPERTKRGAEFLRTADLSRITAITGNREFDYQAVFDFLADRLGIQRTEYIAEVVFCGRFDLHVRPKVHEFDSTGTLLLPYSPRSEEDIRPHLEDNLDQLRDMKSERIAIMTHENPCAEKIGVPNRKAKMQKVLDDYIAGARKINLDTTLFCGHLDKSFDAIQHDGIRVQPISGTEVVVYDSRSGDYSKVTFR